MLRCRELANLHAVIRSVPPTVSLGCWHRTRTSAAPVFPATPLDLRLCGPTRRRRQVGNPTRRRRPGKSYQKSLAKKPAGCWQNVVNLSSVQFSSECGRNKWLAQLSKKDRLPRKPQAKQSPGPALSIRNPYDFYLYCSRVRLSIATGIAVA